MQIVGLWESEERGEAPPTTSRYTLTFPFHRRGGAPGRPGSAARRVSGLFRSVMWLVICRCLTDLAWCLLLRPVRRCCISSLSPLFRPPSFFSRCAQERVPLSSSLPKHSLAAPTFRRWHISHFVWERKLTGQVCVYSRVRVVPRATFHTGTPSRWITPHSWAPPTLWALVSLPPMYVQISSHHRRVPNGTACYTQPCCCTAASFLKYPRDTSHTLCQPANLYLGPSRFPSTAVHHHLIQHHG